MRMKYLLSLRSGRSIFVQCSYGGFSAGSRRFSAGSRRFSACRGTKSLLGRCIVRYICAWGSYSWSFEGSQRISAVSWRFLVVSRRICSDVLVRFRFGWRWTQFWKVLERLRRPGWSQDGPKGGHRDPRKAPQTMKKRGLFYKAFLEPKK